ncbi:Predicted PurR-regulated permease PerM [Flavobacterium fryxellicola]|uniref:AI-2E family transporter n=1 Tax=Flavobacterium fryxellicola TaxID=249352 RepID=A0A167Y9A0_9FLAO|nr:AI-2E family transporter [Flavobacterium fryxellicola]OAB29146.1 AI-2E family transporter [Flavobacterium fryxellicola]SHN57992.1 Predicted PurR-regulated permease PerM [Flavobacterium fryxellicola]
MITSKTISNGILRALLTLAFCGLILLFFYQIQSVLIYLVVSFIMTLIGNPILDFFKRRLKFNHIFATIVVLFIFILIIFGFIMMFVPLVLSQGQNLSLLNTVEIEKDIVQLIEQISVFLDSHQIDSAQLLKEANVTSKVNFNFIPNFLNTILNTISSLGVALGSILFITFFFLKDRLMFIVGAKKLIPNSHEDQILHSLDKINHLLSRYFIGLLLQLFIVFLLYMIVLFIFGVPNAVVIAFLCAVLNIIPYIGPLIASVLAAILTMLSNLGSDFQSEILPTTIYVLIGFWVVQIIDNNFSQPIIFSKSVSSHPLEIFLIILIAGFLFGILGMVVAVPIYTIIKVIGKEFFPENKIIMLLTKDI